uniref:Uncharacterized protein n=1 Tax=Arundo donax TaxID=35708 RepID=A0A0A9AKA7_ARUDO
MHQNSQCQRMTFILAHSQGLGEVLNPAPENTIHNANYKVHYCTTSITTMLMW